MAVLKYSKQREAIISLLLRLDLEFSESTPKTLINSLHATARNFDTPSYWTLTILLLKMWGFSVREIAGQMGLAEKTIYTRIERLKKKIKKVLKK